MKLVDTHCHLNIDPYINELEKYSQILNNDVFIMNVVGTTINDSILAINLSKKYNNIYATIGIHPNEVQNYSLNDINKLEDIYLKNKDKVIAIGETGFDFYYENYDKEKQFVFLNEQFNIAIKYDLTLVLHIRNAHKEAIDFLKSKNKLPRTIIHCFTGNKEDLEEYINLGCYISFSGIITFKNGLDILNNVKYVPLNLLLTETDSPFLTPAPFRGKINNPIYVEYINKKIADVLNIPLNELNETLYKNFIKCFNIKI